MVALTAARKIEHLNYYLDNLKEETVLIWGLDIPPFEVKITEEIRNYINENDIPFDEPCELIEDDVTGLYKLCLKTQNDIDANS